MTKPQNASAEMAHELMNAYEMLREALPLAMQTLLRGDVPLIDQSAFWSCFEQLQNWVDVSAEEYIKPLNDRIDELPAIAYADENSNEAQDK